MVSRTHGDEELFRVEIAHIPGHLAQLGRERLKRIFRSGVPSQGLFFDEVFASLDLFFSFLPVLLAEPALDLAPGP